MKSFLIFALTFLMVSIQVQSQNIEVRFGALLPSDRRSVVLDAGVVGEKMFVIERQNKNLCLKIYDPSSLNFLSSKIIQKSSCKGISDCVPTKFSLEKTIFMKDNFLMLFNSYDKTTKQNVLMAQKITSEGKFEGDLTIVDKIDAKNRFNAGSYMTWQSEDSSKFLVVQNPPYEKYNDEKFTFKVYDSELTNLSNFSVSLPYKDKNVSVVDYYLSNTGDIYMLVNVLKEEKVKGEDRSFYSILSLDGKDGTLSEYDLKLDNKDIEDVALRIDEKTKKVICSGLYSDISKGYTGKKIDGLFYLRLDITKKTIDAKGFKAIDNSVIAAILDISEKKVDKKSKASAESKYFEIMDVIPMKDSTTRLITEYRKLVIVTTTTCDGKGACHTTTNYHYYRKNIFVITIGHDGSIKSFTDIPKYQHTVNDGGKFSSFVICQKGDRMYFLFNDNVENLNESVTSIKDVKPMVRLGKACLVACELNKDGTYTKEKVYDIAEKKIVMMPESAIKVADGEYVIPIQQAPPKGFSCSCITMFSKMKTGIAKITL